MKKRFLLYAVCLCLGLVGCGSQEENKEMNEQQNYAIATCIDGIVMYDMDLYDGENLDNCEIWTFVNAATTGMSGVKYREDTVFGDVVLMCSSNRYAAMVSYPEGEVLWENYDTGKNAHSIEILPSGNIVVAASTGNCLRIFATSALLENDTVTAATYKEYELEEGHGVLWDPEYKILWAMGEKIINAYSVVGEGVNEELQFIENKSIEYFGLDGHDLTADFLDVNYLWISGKNHVFHFNKETGELETKYDFSDVLDTMKAKGFGNNPYGNYFLTQPSLGIGTSWEKEKYASWSTDKIQYFRLSADGSTLEKTECKSATRAFYKVFSFYGKYQ